MSTSDDERDRSERERRDSSPDRAESGRGREIAIPGYRPAASDGPRHRPPSVQRSEVAGRRVTGGQAAVRVGDRSTGSQRAVRVADRVSGSHRAVGDRITGSQRAVRPRSEGSGGQRVADRITGGHRAVSARATPARGSGPSSLDGVRPIRTSGPPSAAEAPAPDALRADAASSGPRGIEELQAEMARDDIRLMARQITEAAAEPAPRASIGASLPSPSLNLSGLRRWRPYIAGALIVGALIVGGLPVLSDHQRRAHHGRLAVAVQEAARAAGAAASPGEVAGWIGERDLEALKAFYAAQRPRIIEALNRAGFEDVGSREVSIRVDYDRATLVIGVTMGQDDRGLVVGADLEGRLVGRTPPPTGLSAAFAEQGGLLTLLASGAGLIIAGLWLAPMALGRRKG